MAFNVKENKCFVPAFTPVYSDSKSETVDGNGGSAYIIFSDDAITAGSVAIITIVRADSDTIEDITENHVIADGAVQVKLMNSGTADATITVNCVVL